MTARSIIAQGCCRNDQNKIDTADAIISSLKNAGYSIVKTEELERAVEIANRNEASPEGDALARALKGGRS